MPTSPAALYAVSSAFPSDIASPCAAYVRVRFFARPDMTVPR